MVLLKNNFTNLRQPTPDTSFAVPRYGLGCAFYYNSATTIKLFSDHISGNCYVPVTNGLGDNLTVEFAPGGSGMTLDLGASAGAGAIDTGSKEASRFYSVRIISKRGESPALLAHLNGKRDFVGQAQATFTFSGAPAEDCTLTLTDNASSPVPKVYFIDDNASDGTSKIGVENITEYGGGASGTAFALAEAINTTTGFGINAVVNTSPSTRVTLFHTYSGTPATPAISKTGDWDAATSVNIPSAFAELPAFTLPSGYTHYSDVIWGVAVNSSGNISGFSTVAPGQCRYQVGAGGSISKGLQVAVAAYTTQTAGTTEIDLTDVVPAPTANSSFTTSGVAYASARAVCTDTSADIDCNLYWSRDVRSTYDPNNEEGLDLLCSLQNLGKVDNGSTADLFQTFEVPLQVAETASGYTIPSVGRADNLLQYVFSAAEDRRGLDVWITGWKLNG